MSRLVWLSALLAGAALVALGYGLRALTSSSSTNPPPALVPACPRPSYGADGNVSPLFCRVDNPLALRFYGWVVDDLLALGPDAAPDAVYRVLQRHRDSLTGPEMCNVYALAAWAEHWHFGINPALELTNDLC